MEVVRLSSKGQLVLPKNVRERLALKRGSELNVELREEKIILEPIRQETKDSGILTAIWLDRIFTGKSHLLRFFVPDCQHAA